MSVNVTIAAEDVWDYILEHQDELSEEMHEIASNDEDKIVVYVTREKVYPEDFLVKVEKEGEEILDEPVFDLESCEEFVDYVYRKFVFGYIDESEEMYEREIELFNATDDYLGVVSEHSLYDKEVEEIQNDLLSYLSSKHGIRIYRPTVMDDDEGFPYIENYPYDVEDDFYEDYEDDDDEEIVFWED